MKPKQSAPVDGRLRDLASAIDLKDVMALAGTGMVFHGLNMVHVPSAFVVTGGLLILAAVAGAIRRSRGATPKER